MQINTTVCFCFSSTVGLDLNHLSTTAVTPKKIFSQAGRQEMVSVSKKTPKNRRLRVVSRTSVLS